MFGSDQVLSAQQQQQQQQQEQQREQHCGQSCQTGQQHSASLTLRSIPVVDRNFLWDDRYPKPLTKLDLFFPLSHRSSAAATADTAATAATAAVTVTVDVDVELTLNVNVCCCYFILSFHLSVVHFRFHAIIMLSNDH